MLIRLGVLLMGVTLIVGQYFFPDYTIMWFASPDLHFALWRQVLVVGLGLNFITKTYYDNPYLHAFWAALALGLVWGGAGCFLDHPAYMFDALLMLGAGVCFAIEALQKIPVETPIDAQKTIILSDWLHDLIHPHARKYVSAGFRSAYRSTIRDDSHILVIR
jgi:hypothetical protein